MVTSVLPPALVFGKPASPRMPMRHTSLSLDWRDSDSSIDSMPSTEEEEGAGDEDWPAQTGFHVSVTTLVGQTAIQWL